MRAALSRGNAPLIDNSPEYAHWDAGRERCGRNRLGILLTRRRAQLVASLRAGVFASVQKRRFALGVWTARPSLGPTSLALTRTYVRRCAFGSTWRFQCPWAYRTKL
jgi:hypothetical protein